jgi:predicted MFS family arabinose efflux permease
LLPERHSRATLAVLFLVNVLNIYDRQALGAVVEPLRREFHLTDRQLGAIPTAFIVIYALAGVPLGRLVDRWSRKRLLAIGVAVWAGLTGLGGLAASYWMLLGTRLGVGIGEAVCAPAATSWIGDVVPAGRRARAMAWFMMAVPVGVMLSFAISGPAAQAYGWRTALALAAAPAALLVPALLWIPEPVRAGGAAPAAVAILRVPALWWIAISGAVVNFVLYSFSYFIAAFLTRFHGLSVAQAGVWSGVGSGVAGVLGALAAGTFGDRARGGGRLRFAGLAALAAAPLAYVAIGLPRGRAGAAIVLLMAAYGLWQMYYGLVYAAIQDLVGPALRGTAMAVYFLIMYLGGGAFGPLAVGSLSDRLAAAAEHAGALPEAARAAGLHGAMYVIPAMSLVLAAVLWTGARYSRTAAVSPVTSSNDTGGL